MSASASFNRSTHSMMSQIEAQSAYRKDIRNIKLSAKKKKRI